jgi:predicted exporter
MSGTTERSPARAGAPPRWLLPLALLWLAFMVLLSLSIPGRLRQTGGLDTSLLSLLPDSAHDPEVADAVQRIAGVATRKLVFLVGQSDFEHAVRAASACKQELAKAGAWLTLAPAIDTGALGAGIDFVRPYRTGLLSSADREALTHGADKLVEQTIAELYQPVAPPRLFPLEEDPLGLASHFMLERTQGFNLGIHDGWLTLERDGTTWVMVAAELRSDALSFSAEQALAPVLDRATQAARDAGASRVLRSGFIFHAAAAGTRANREMSTIGLGSMLAVMLLMWLPFGSLRPVLLVLLPIGVGTLLALGVDVWVFNRLHLLTLVFGSSIVGVAEDFGVHFVCGALEDGPFEPWRHMRHIFRGLVLALVTTIVAYLALAALPFPGLRQMGIFGAAGLLGGWITAVLWLPFLARKLGKPRGARFVPALARMEAAWLRVARTRWLRAALVVVSLFALGGFLRAHVNDDVRALYDSVPALSGEEDALRSVLRVPNDSQFFLVRGADPEEVLEREEALVSVLSAERAAGHLDGWQSLSDAVPSRKRQRENRELVARAYAAHGGVERLFSELDDAEALARARDEFNAHSEPLSLATWLRSPLSAMNRHLWLDGKSVVLLRGAHAQGELEHVTRAAAGLPGVVFVDQVANISRLLGGFRRALSWFVPLGYALVTLCLLFFYGRDAWRVAAPAAMGSFLAIGLPALFGHALTLFDLLALVLVLGIGIDYGIFMNEPREHDFSVAFLSVTLGAASTLLSFGLLATSGTPALSNFGLTLLIGIGASWWLTPCFMRDPERTGEPVARIPASEDIRELRC